MAGARERTLRRGPAPIASFDHDGSDETSPDAKQAFTLPEIREDGGGAGSGGLAPPEPRARSHSSPTVAGALATPPAPRIDISRASSSSHHDSRDSSPELAAPGGLGFREDGALDLRSSTEELAFLEGADAKPPEPPSRRHSRKDSQGSEAALLAVSGRTSRLSSVGSAASAVSRLSVASGAERSPSPHKMLLETSFCGPKPIETDPDVCAAAVEERLLEIVKSSVPPSAPPNAVPPAAAVSPPGAPPGPVDARDRREVRTEATVEASRPAAPRPCPAAPPVVAVAPHVAPEKVEKEIKNKAKVEERRTRSRDRRERSSEPEVYRSVNRSKDIVRIKLRPDSDDDDDESERTLMAEPARKPATLELRPEPEPGSNPRASPAAARRPRSSRTPSPAGAPVSRKSSFCSLFKSKETIASPDSPSDALRRKRSLTEGRSRSRSRDRSATPSSAGKLRGSVLSLFKSTRRSATSPTPSSRASSPARPAAPRAPPVAVTRVAGGEKLKYYEDTQSGVIHIPLRTPPDEQPGAPRDPVRPASAPQPRLPPASSICSQPSTSRQPPGPAPGEPSASTRGPTKPIKRTVLPDGSIIIPLHSPTEKTTVDCFPPPEPKVVEAVLEKKDSSNTITSTSNGQQASSDRSSAETKPSPDDSKISHMDISPDSRVTTPAESATPDGRARRKERLVFTTHVGSREQVFSTQFSLTKTPSVTSEISGSFASFPESEPALRDTHIGSDASVRDITPARDVTPAATPDTRAGSPLDATRDSSGSDISCGSETVRGLGSSAEARGLVVQESFEEELPYVPTTLPQERSLALPMLPVRDRAALRPPAATSRPRAASQPTVPTSTLPRAPLSAPPRAPQADKLRIRLPRRPPAPTPPQPLAPGPTPPPKPQRSRSRSRGDSAPESRKADWIDFEEVPERRKLPKRIQTLPAAAASGSRDVVFSYVEPEHCRCECHVRPDDELPLLAAPGPASSTSLEGEEGGHASPFIADFDLHLDALNKESCPEPRRGQ